MASKAGQPEADKVDIEEALEYVDKTLDRTKVLYEQYFLGMQKQPPSQIHTDVERRLRDLQQMQIRNTGLRYRFATLQQKFGSYNSYWRRTLKQIENGTYIRNLQKISRKAALSGEAIPEEILAAMPKRMREQVKRDREQALAIAKRRNDTQSDSMEFGDDDVGPVIGEAPEIKRQLPRGGLQFLSEDDGDLDFEAFFASVEKSDDTQENIPVFQEPVAAKPPVAPAPVRPIVDDEAPRAPQAVPMQSRGTGSVPARPSQPTMPSGTQPPNAAGPQHPRGVTQPGTGARPGPPPVPGRTTAPMAALRQSGPISAQTGSIPVDQTDPMPTLPTGAVPTFAQTGSLPTRASQLMQTQPMQTQPMQTQPMQTQPMRPSQLLPTDMQTTDRMPTDAQRTTLAIPTHPVQRPTPMPQRATGPAPVVPPPAGSAMDRTRTGPVPAVQQGAPAQRPSGPVPPPGARPVASAAGPIPIPRIAVPNIPRSPGAPSQVTKPNPIAPGSSTARPAVPVETMSGPFPRAAAPPVHPRPEPPKIAPPRPQAAPPRPPPGMNDADVNALYATYVKAKKAVGEEAGPGSYGKLLQTINAQAPKIMEQYKAKGVEFSVVVKDNQVIIKAKPKT